MSQVDPNQRTRRDGHNAGHVRFLLAFFLFHIALLLIIYLAQSIFPVFSEGNFEANFYWPPDRAPTVEDAFRTWDGQHYLYLAENGYPPADPKSMEHAYYPLWPALVRIFSFVFAGDFLTTALFLAGILSASAALLLKGIVEMKYGADVARWSVVFAFAYPGALFAHLPYTESLFLFLLCAFFWGLEKQKSWVAAVAAIFLPLCRPVGCLVAIAALVRCLSRDKNGRDFAVLACFPIGVSIYLLLMWLMTGDPFIGFKAQELFYSQASLLNVLRIGEFARELCSNWTVSHGFVDSSIDRAAFVLSLVVLWLSRRLGAMYVLTAFLLIVFPAMSAHFMSYMRYAGSVFPLFIGLALFTEQWSCMGKAILAGILFALQMVFLLMFTNNYWVG